EDGLRLSRRCHNRKRYYDKDRVVRYITHESPWRNIPADRRTSCAVYHIQPRSYLLQQRPASGAGGLAGRLAVLSRRCDNAYRFIRSVTCDRCGYCCGNERRGHELYSVEWRHV